MGLLASLTSPAFAAERCPAQIDFETAMGAGSYSQDEVRDYTSRSYGSYSLANLKKLVAQAETDYAPIQRIERGVLRAMAECDKLRGSDVVDCKSDVERGIAEAAPLNRPFFLSIARCMLNQYPDVTEE